MNICSLLWIFAISLADCKLVTISNKYPRLDSNGNIMDAHDGTIIQFNPGEPFYYYAMGYGLCKEYPGPNGIKIKKIETFIEK